MSDKSNQMLTKMQILTKSGRLVKMLASFAFLAICLYVFIKLQIMDSNKTILENICMATSLAFLFIFIVISIKNMVSIINVLQKKYEIRALKILSIKFRHPHAKAANKDRILEMNGVRITVDDLKASQFEVGDTAIVVFENGIKYPMLILNEKELTDAHKN